jgi:UDP-N-acetylmuramate dehydrogenase
MNWTCNPLLNYSLRQRNTLNFEVNAQFVMPVTQAEQIPVAINYAKEHDLAYQVLGGGSNVLLPKQLTGLTLLMDIDFIELDKDDISGVQLRVGAGVNWHQLVSWTLEQGYLGLENLALIPGTVGAAPIQNIGAYGVEVEQYIDHVEAYDCECKQWVMLSKTDCQFSYRHSLFKEHPKRFIITAVVFDLPKNWQPRISYADLNRHFAGVSPEDISANAIFAAVCKIRSEKLPDPKIIGNVGSFFQNPIVSNEQLNSLKREYPQIVSYPENSIHSKLAAGWLIDQCGFKGMQRGHVGVHTKQALVLTHDGEGDATELLHLASEIQKAVNNRFGVLLEIEPIIYK